MAEHPLMAVYAYVERAYLRLQACDVLTHCLEQENTDPMQKLVEELVLAGPQSLSALREILAEVATRKAQLKDDQHQVFLKMKDDLKRYKVNIPGLHTPDSLARLTPVGILSLLRQQGVKKEHDLLTCLQLLQDTLDLIDKVVEHLGLLEEIEICLQDWMWGLMYQSTRQGWPEGGYLTAQKNWPI